MSDQFDEFFEVHQPKLNPRNDGYGPSIDELYCMFETYGDDLEEVLAQAQLDERKVFTLVEDEDRHVAVSGYHHVNRLGYFIVDKGWEKDVSYCLWDDEA